MASTRISPIRSRVRKVEDIPARFLSRNSVRLKCGADRDDQLGALLVREQHRDVLARADAGDDLRVEAEPLEALAPGARPSG